MQQVGEGVKGVVRKGTEGKSTSIITAIEAIAIESKSIKHHL